MKLIFMLSTLFCASYHPISLIMILIMNTLMVSMTLSWVLKNSWISMIFLLAILGGMLILFIYMASLAANEPFKFNNLIWFIIPIFLMPFKVFLFPLKPMNYSELEILFSSFCSINSVIAIFYLLFALLVVIDNISMFKSALRTNN